MIKHFISFSNFKQKIRYFFFLKLYTKTWCINLKLENVNEKNHHSSYIIMKPVFFFFFLNKNKNVQENTLDVLF